MPIRGLHRRNFTSYNDLANVNSGDCTNAPASADFTGDGQVQLEDLLDFLGLRHERTEWGIDWVQDGCSVEAMGIADLGVSASGRTYATATNYDPTSSFDEHLRVVGLHRQRSTQLQQLGHVGRRKLLVPRLPRLQRRQSGAS